MLQALPGVPEHVVTIKKADGGGKVGIGLSALEGRCLRIVKVDAEGLMSTWNTENPTKQVRRGDRIMEVNGIRGDARAMIEACKYSGNLQLLIRFTADLEQRHRMLQYRNLRPEDFELLQLLDAALPARTCVQRSFVVRLPRFKACDVGVDKCLICLSDCEKDDELTQLPCQHCFCTKCIEMWLTECRSHCPMCLAPVICPEEDEASPSALHDDSGGSDIGRESEDDDCSALVHASILASKIVSATRCEGLGSRGRSLSA